jgi:hypothetical protein
LRIAREQEFKDAFPDCETGSMPPFGIRYDMPVYGRTDLAANAANEEITFSAGSHRDWFRCAGTMTIWVRPVNPLVEDLKDLTHHWPARRSQRRLARGRVAARTSIRGVGFLSLAPLFRLCFRLAAEGLHTLPGVSRSRAKARPSGFRLWPTVASDRRPLTCPLTCPLTLTSRPSDRQTTAFAGKRF